MWTEWKRIQKKRTSHYSKTKQRNIIKSTYKHERTKRRKLVPPFLLLKQYTHVHWLSLSFEQNDKEHVCRQQIIRAFTPRFRVHKIYLTCARIYFYLWFPLRYQLFPLQTRPVDIPLAVKSYLCTCTPIPYCVHEWTPARGDRESS